MDRAGVCLQHHHVAGIRKYHEGVQAWVAEGGLVVSVPW